MATFERFCEMKGLKLPASISGENTTLGNVLSIAPQVFDESPLPNFTAQMDKPLQAFEPPMFSGDSDPCSWLEACVRYFRVSKVPANEMVDEAGWYLENKAYFWFLDWENGRFPIPWDEFSQAISCQFASLTPNPITKTLAMEPGIVCATLSYSSTGHICVDKASSKLFPLHSSLLHTNSNLKRDGSTPHTLCVAFSPGDFCFSYGECMVCLLGRGVKKWKPGGPNEMGSCHIICYKFVEYVGTEIGLSFKEPYQALDESAASTKIIGKRQLLLL
ncbi:hypothetical protein LINPERHAP2_LOCUS11754 [Linum perenne]